MSIVFDDSDAAEGGFELPPDGDYLVEIIGAETGTSKKGDGMVTVKAKLLDFAREDGGTTWFFDTWMMTGKGAGIGKKKAKGFGIALEKGQSVEPSSWIGLRAIAHLTVEGYAGKDGKPKRRLVADIGRGGCGYSPEGAPDTPQGEGDEFANIPF